MSENNNSNKILLGAILLAIFFVGIVTSIPTSYITNEEVVTIDIAHEHIHEGNHYFVKTYVVNSGTGVAAEFIFTTPNETHDIHAKVKITTDVDYTIEIFENATFSDNGTFVPGMNNNRNSNISPLLLTYVTPTLTDDGQLMWAARTGNAKNPIGVSPGTTYEIIARYNTTYMFRLTQNVAGASVADVDFWWYETEGHDE